jgi:hypothetical protein
MTYLNIHGCPMNIPGIYHGLYIDPLDPHDMSISHWNPLDI